MQKSKIIYNSLSAVLQVVVVGLIYIVLYKYLLTTIGIKLLGVWSLIIATTSIALIANFGISTSIVKFVSTYYSRKDFESLKKLIFTASVFIIATYLIVSIFIFFVAKKALVYFIEPDYIDISIEILPFSLISLIINALGGVISSSLDGIQKNYIRSYIISFSSVILLLLSLLLTPKYGLKGLIFAQIFQAFIVLMFSFFYLNKHIKGVFDLKWNWSKEIFKEIINYGLKLQALSFMQMSFEPITKALLSKFGGLAMVGYYEMANRLVSQFRSVIVSANQVVIPVIAEAKEKNSSFIKELYYKSFSIILFVNIILTTGIIIAVPIISKLWIGHVESIFIFSVIVNSVVVFINICSNPAYFSYLGEGKLNPLIYSYLLITIINAALSYVLGFYFGGYGVILAWNIAFVVGSLMVVISYHRTNQFRLIEIVTKNDLFLILSAIIIVVTTYFIYFNIDKTQSFYFGLLFLVIEIMLFCFFIIKNKTFTSLLMEMKRLLNKNKLV